MKRDGINDTATFGKHKETGEYHGLLYINHPTPSGEPRMMLWTSTKFGYATANEAVDALVSKLKPEILEDLDIMKVEGSE